MIAEPDDVLRTAIVQGLARRGARVRTSHASDLESIARLETISVIVLAVDQLDEPSIDPIRKVRALPEHDRRATPAVALLGSGASASVRPGLLFELFDHVVAKPVRAEELVREIMVLLGVAPAP